MDTHTHTNLSADPNGLTTTIIRNRLRTRIASGHPWKQILQTASDATVHDVCLTLQAYSLLWPTTSAAETESEKGSGVLVASSTQHEVVAGALALELLFDASERDLEKGLSFIREVEKGSHMREDAVRGFRPDAIGVLCGLCREMIAVLKPRRRRERAEDEDDVDGDGEGGETEQGREKEEGLEETDGAEALEAARQLIGTIYQGVETQLKTRLQSLVHQHKTKTRRK